MTDEEYLAGLIQQDDKVLRAIYQNYAARISHYILQKGGSKEDAKDVFQDALMVILNKVQSPNFQLTSSFYTYLFSVSKLIWYNKSRKKSRSTVTIPDDNTLKDSEDIEQALLNREMDKVYRDNFSKLGMLCQQLLRLFFAKKDMTKIAEELELKNEHTARTRKYRCQEKLRKLMESDNRYQELRD